MKSLQLLLIASAILIAKPQSSQAHASPAQDHLRVGVGKVYAGYLNIQQALVNDDFKKAATSSASLLDSLKKVQTKGLDVTTKSRWDSSAARMTAVLVPMASSKDIVALRSQFKNLTPLVADAIEKFGMKSTSSAYLFHCPMAKADWLQKDKTTANPFYGQSMSECGSLVREVKAL